MGIHETLDTSPELQNMIMSNPGRDDLTAFMQDQGMVSLFHDGLERVLEGRTTIDEVSRSISI
jgi:type IV pilus assembly protein PilB